MIKLNKLLILLLLMLDFKSYGEIIPTYSIGSNTVKKLLPKIDASTLVLVNIDNTVITPKSKMFRYNDNPYLNFMDNLYSLANINEGINAKIALLIKQRQMMLVEQYWPSFIDKMKTQGAIVLGFTKTTIQYNLIDNYEGWLYTILQGFNINFTNKVNDKEAFRFDQADASSPIFYAGIIFTGSVNKVKTLIQLLEILPNRFTKIVIFENSKIELKRLDDFLRTVDIVYYGIEYLGWQQLAGSPDEAVTKLQQATLLNTGKWLEDIEAENILKSHLDHAQ